MQSLFIISYSDLARDSQVNKQICCLSKGCKVIAAELREPELPVCHFISLARTVPKKCAFARETSASRNESLLFDVLTTVLNGQDRPVATGKQHSSRRAA